MICPVDLAIGSVGMSGDLPDNDEACSIAGIQKAGFETEVDEEALGTPVEPPRGRYDRRD